MTIIPVAGRLTVAALALSLMATTAPAQMHGGGHGHGAGQGMMHGNGMMHHGQDGTGHDEVTMPGLQGLNATPGESDDLRIMFHHFDTLYRDVENLPNGIRTVTGATDPYVMDALVRHVTQMIGRVEAGDDPQIFIQSPTLDIFFARYEGLETDIEVTEEGIIVTQTSDDPELVTALQTHAAEVSDMAARGMQAVHERMMQGSN